MDLYREEIIDHYKNPRNFGEMDDPTVRVFEVNTFCGDNLEFFLKIKDNIITEAKFRCLGCAISTATSSMLTEKLTGLEVDKAKNISENEILELLGGEISAGRKKCAFLPLVALRKALVNLTNLPN